MQRQNTAAGARRVVLLTPSRGLGGGIERYTETLEWAFAEHGVDCARVDLHGRGAAAHARMFAEAGAYLRAGAVPPRLVAAHPSLLPAASLLGRRFAAAGISVICHGTDAWSTRGRARRGVERRLMAGRGVRVVAVSSFTAGSLPNRCRAALLPPALSRTWFRMLAGAAAGLTDSERGDGLRLVTAFRLANWRDKGLPELLEAAAALKRRDVTVTVCGSGCAPPSLLQAVNGYRGCTLRAGLSDRALARELAAADLFVLATRTRRGRYASGEGFGLVLLEAQVAGTPVVAPAYGGSHDAFLNGVTGAAPADESARALAQTLDQLLADPVRLARMGERAAAWAREAFAPECYPPLVAARLL